jgi:hypothetical protein
MTTRQRQAPESATAPVANAGLEKSAHFSWEDWFRHANSQQRDEALGLAQRQGLLYPHQLPAISNGVKPASAAKDIEPSPVISRLLAGKADALPRLRIDALSFFDAELDDLQRQAVARAIGTPELLLLQGLPGTGKSRVLTEIVLQAAARGWRILFLAGQTASLDVVLHRLLGRPEILALRFLDALEKPESLPGWLRGYTLDGQKQAFLERALAGTRENDEQAEFTCRQRRAEEPLWAELRNCAQRWRDLETRLHALQTQLSRIGEAVETEAETTNSDSAFLTSLAQLRQERDAAVREIEIALRTQQGALAKCEQEANELAARIAEREPAYLAKKHGRFWTLNYWINLFNGSILQEMDVLLEDHAKAQASRQEMAQHLDQITEKRHRRQEQFNQERAAHLAREIEARQQVLLLQQQALEIEAGQLEAEWHALCRRLDARPAKTSEAVASAHQAWQQKKKTDEQQRQFAQQCTKFVEETGPSLAAKLPSFANLLAGTIIRWHTDGMFREAGAAPVDLLIVEDAETLTEADLLKLSRQARRCVLVVQALAEPTPAPTALEKASRALLPAPLVSATCWNKLWQTLGGEAGHWPCAWQRAEGRLVCQLMPLSAEDRQYLEGERLADAPDIELRILHRPRTRPCLAQVIFAPHCTFADAFKFMVCEVQEFPLEPLGRTGWWSEDPQHHCWHLGPNAGRIQAWLEIEPGVRLGTVADEHGDATRTACLEFDKNGGWDCCKAEAWLYRHRPVHDHQRTIFLQTPYRFERPLAQIVRTVVRASDWPTASWPPDSEPEAQARGKTPGDKKFEFIAVPPFSKQEWPREGAGLELDLSTSRNADRLPVGLRHSLPARGFVNYLEAQALIRRLETWLRKESADSCRVAVLALYQGQVELLRRLIEQSETLRAGNFPLEVALPSRLHQRECEVVFLSLTRSHAHRSVAFGEDVNELPLALTRARGRLFVFGDPGSLCKRTNWHGPLDHLDAQSAHQELLRLSRLLTYLQKQGHTLPKANGLANGTDSLI